MWRRERKQLISRAFPFFHTFISVTFCAYKRARDDDFQARLSESVRRYPHPSPSSCPPAAMMVPRSPPADVVGMLAKEWENCVFVFVSDISRISWTIGGCVGPLVQRYMCVWEGFSAALLWLRSGVRMSKTLLLKCNTKHLAANVYLACSARVSCFILVTCD